MKLIYRGVSYDYALVPSVAADVIDEKVEQVSAVSTRLKYRGAPYFHGVEMPIHELICRPIRNLFYRGAAYSLNQCIPH